MRRVPAGDYLFHKGDPSAGIYYLTTGRLRMQRVTQNGGTVTLHIARDGELFAEASLFSDCYQCDVIAELESEVWLYSRDRLTAQLRDDPAALWEFAAGLARSLHDMRLRYELKQIRSAPERVLQLLRLRCDAGGIYRAAGTLKDLAAELGLTHEALYRALATLESQGQIYREASLLQVLPVKLQ